MSNSPVEVSLEQLVKLSNKSGCREEPFLDGLKFRSPVGSDLRETFGHWCFFFFFFQFHLFQFRVMVLFNVIHLATLLIDLFKSLCSDL